MLSLMRKHASSWIIKFLLAAIIVVFIPWGVQRYTSGRSGRVAEVNGSIITLDDYRNTYRNLVEQVRQSFGNNVNDEFMQTLQLPKRALDQLIDRVLMLQAAEKLKIQVSDEELAQAIGSIAAFQTAGVFDNQRYLNFLSRTQLTPETFENEQREAITINKLQSFISGSIKVSNIEAQQWYKFNNAEVDIDYVLLEPQQMKGTEATADEIKAHFEANKENYKTDPELKIRYLYLNPENYEDKVTVSAEDVSDYYESNLEQFKSPQTVQARHILIKVDKNATPEQVQEARQRIEAVHKLAIAGEDFAELAAEYSEGPTKTKGGDLGTFRRQDMVKPFSDKAFAMQAGEISEPVRTDFGWHIIKVEQVNPASIRTLDEARSEIESKLKADQSRNLAYDEAEAIFNAAFEGRNFADLVKERNLKMIYTDFFTRKKGPQGAQNARQLAEAAFELPLNEISEIQELGNGYYLIEALEKRPAQIPELETVKAAVKKDLIKEKQDAEALRQAQAIVSEIKETGSLAAVAEKFNLKPQTSGLFKRTDPIPVIGYEPDIARAAFTLSESNKIYADAIKGQKGYYVISLRERKAPALDGFEKEKSDIKARLLQQKAFTTMEAWLNRKKDESEIVIEEGFWKS
ncbi:MAG: SurA N-terminal domain-containing protein [Deltaproteobacteria bacterium]|jgi:peptidyl-prolyl cis-trans isomerase D|nr:SurA N-terminal domain-containing protein [Deltaproteobacteria bacterium]